jgi:hypothetical protein
VEAACDFSGGHPTLAQAYDQGCQPEAIRGGERRGRDKRSSSPAAPSQR